jgi:phenylacetate-CoA ligase
MSVGDPELALWGPPLQRTYREMARTLRDRMLATQLISAYEMNGSTMSQYLDLIESGRWRQIFAYPSAIYMLALHARKEGRNLVTSGIKVIFVTGELLLAHQRKVIETTFGCPVANGYGGRDSGFIAHECPEGGMHVMADAVIVEIVDSRGRPVAPGEAGDIVVTDLYSEEAPILRYATGDRGVFSSRQCACGRSLPMLERIDGRAVDAVIAPDRRAIPGLALNPVFWNIEGLDQVRVCQKALDHYQVQIVKSDRFLSDNENRIREGFARVLGSPVQVTFEYLSAIPKEQSGKFRFIVSELSQSQALGKIEQGHAN